MMSLIASILSGLSSLGSGIVGLFAAKQQANAEVKKQDEGAALAENETIQVIAEKADEQAVNNTAARDALDIADRLRRDAANEATAGRIIRGENRL